MPHPTPQEGIGISYGSRLPTSTCLGILPEVSRVHTVGLKRDDLGHDLEGYEPNFGYPKNFSFEIKDLRKWL
jgi:hypothetical protein